MVERLTGLSRLESGKLSDKLKNDVKPFSFDDLNKVQINSTLVATWMAGHDPWSLIMIGQYLMQSGNGTFDIHSNSAGAMGAAAVMEVMANWPEMSPALHIGIATILAAALPPHMLRAMA